MRTNRLEAFSDGVIAILITIMVLDLKRPDGATFHSLDGVRGVFLSYVLSFVYVAIYWNNHHHMLQLTDRVTGAILWANMHLLFWLSVVPFVTGWMGENPTDHAPTATYGMVLLMAGMAYFVLSKCIIANQGPSSRLAAAIGRDAKGVASLVMYSAAIGLAFVATWMADVLYISVAVMWLVPDRRIERHIAGQEGVGVVDG